VEHESALAVEITDLLLPAVERGGVVVDATVGRGGHAAALLEAAPQIEIIGIDRDPEALEASRAYLSADVGRVRLVRDDFKNLPAVLERLGVASVRGVLFDLGVSSPQLDVPGRGFSFREGGPLDMRMDPSQELSAHHVVNEYSQRDLARVIRRYGEERFARRIAAAIVANRPVTDTLALAEIVKEAIPAATRRTGAHPAKRTFQALRIEVNRELDALEIALPGAVAALSPGGRLAVLSYHSLEDRIVKRFFAQESRGCVCPPDFPVCRCSAEARLRLLTKRPLRPGEAEVTRNPRVRSARLRVAEKLGARAGGATE
jgi:16S rRNA (cytosine1402-N4)-methyltransferase